MPQEGKERKLEDARLSHRPPRSTEEGGDTGAGRMVSSRERRKRLQTAGESREAVRTERIPLPADRQKSGNGSVSSGKRVVMSTAGRVEPGKGPEPERGAADRKEPAAGHRAERSAGQKTESRQEAQPSQMRQDRKETERAVRRERRRPEAVDMPGSEDWEAVHEKFRQAAKRREEKEPRDFGLYEKKAYSARYEEEKKRYAEKARKKRRREKVQLWAGILLAAALVALLAVIGWRAIRRPNASAVEGTPASTADAGEIARKLSEADFQYTVPEDKKETGTPQEKKQIGDYEGYAVRYPSLGNETADADLSQRAGDMIAVFQKEAAEKKSGETDRMLMTADYEAYQTGTGYVSVKFDIHKEFAGTEEDSIETYTYRLSDGAAIGLSDLLKEGYLDFLSGKTREFAASQGGTVSETAVAANEANFSYYTWNEDGLMLYFLPGTLTDSQESLLSLTIPMEEMTEYLTEDITGQGLPVGGQASSVDPEKPMVCLTFDDGPKASTTPELLDILEENDARATFFVVGESLQKEGAQEIIRRELELGCQVGNHTLNHKNFKEISDEEITQQIEGVNDILKGWGFPACSTVRPPYGGWNNHVLAYITEYPLARWNVDTLDWKTKDVQSTINAVLYDEKTKAADGDIILMHDIHPETIEACRTIIPELKARGFQLVTMEEMFAAKGIDYQGGKVYYSADVIKTDFGS